MTSEQKIQNLIIKEYERAGWYVLKLAKTNKNGIPDLLCLRNDGGVKDILFVEVKAENGVLSMLQQYRIKELQNFGFNWQVRTPKGVDGG